MTWQPIETAPKDGTIVDLWYPAIGRATDYAWRDDELFEGRWVHEDRPSGDSRVYVNVSPTHWMPLPAPPEAP